MSKSISQSQSRASALMFSLLFFGPMLFVMCRFG